MSLRTREESLAALRREQWDVLVIGGGINGAGLLRDLTLRSHIEHLGLKIALIEKSQFGAGTSSKNSQLVHGGLRYLKYLHLSLVRQSLRERQALLRLAPHLVRPQAFVLPFRTRGSALVYSAGLWLYDVLAGRHAIKHFSRLDRSDLAHVLPRLAYHRARGAAIFYDAVMEAGRLVLENIWAAHQQGALAVNYTPAEQLLADRSGKVVGVQARDALSGQPLDIHARLVVNATGPWGDLLRAKTVARSRSLQLVRGSHLVFPQLLDGELALAFFDKEGRIVFATPWGARGELTLVGTTEVLHTDGPERIRVSSAEKDYLIDAVSEWLPQIQHNSPVGCYSSLRPLVASRSLTLSAASRDARIWTGREGMIHIAGGKYTTYRAMAATTADLVCRRLNIRCRRKDLTTAYPLAAAAPSLRADEKWKNLLAVRSNLERPQLEYLARMYGTRLEEFLSLPAAAKSFERIHPELQAVWGQVVFAIQYEMAATVSDFTSVSTYLRYYRRWRREEILPIAAFMGQQLGWDRKRIEEEAETEYRQCTLDLDSSQP